MIGNRIPSKSNNGRHAHVLCLLFYVSDRLIYDIFNFSIRVPNMIAQKLKTGQSTQHELFNKVRLEKLPNSFKFSLHTYFCAWTIWPSYPTGVAVLLHGVGQNGFLQPFARLST